MLVCELWHGREARCGHRCDAFFGPCGLEKGVARSVSRPKTSSAMALEDREATEMQPLEEGSEATVTEQQAESLAKVCAAYASYNPEIGYCQGMNFVVAVLLVVSGQQIRND